MATTTVILPIYNEERVIGRIFDEVHGFGLQHEDYRFIFVDDGSTDRTPLLLEGRLQQANQHQCGLLRHAPNAGKGFAVRTGVAVTTTPFVCFLDGDLAYSLDYLPRLCDALNSHEVVIGVRALDNGSRQHLPPMRQFMGWGFNRLTRIMFRLPHGDTQAGLKGFRREAARRIFGTQQIFDFAFDVEVLYLARRFGYRIAEIPVKLSPSHAAKGSSVNVTRHPFSMFLSLLRIRYNGVVGKYE
jgi:dolichyl-phosphate beta-glucosyltransferase